MLQFVVIITVVFYPTSMRSIVSGSWSLKQCWVYVISPGVQIKSCQILAGYSLQFYAVLVLAYLPNSA